MDRDLSSKSLISEGKKKLLRDQSFIIGASNSNSKFFPPIKNFSASKNLRRDYGIHQASKDSLKRQISFLKIW